MRAPRRAFVWIALALGASGCMTVARVFLDIPEGDGNVAPVSELPEGILEQVQMKAPELPPPPIESVLDPDSVLALLPSDRSGGVDWVAAVEQGVIRPRAGGADDEPNTAVSFSYDLYLHGGSGPEAYFPHSAHRVWLDCTSCHPTVYRNGSESVTGETAHGESSCGHCHGPVAFPIQTCERCHEAADDLPQDRRSKGFGGALQMTRLSEGAFAGIEVADLYPPASFPHTEHRMRFQCRACHESPFPMELGASMLSQEEAHSLSGCGKCHNGETAFRIDPESCSQCHVQDTG